jgi:hypothetical protein
VSTPEQREKDPVTGDSGEQFARYLEDVRASVEQIIERSARSIDHRVEEMETSLEGLSRAVAMQSRGSGKTGSFVTRLIGWTTRNPPSYAYDELERLFPVEARTRTLYPWHVAEYVRAQMARNQEDRDRAKAAGQDARERFLEARRQLDQYLTASESDSQPASYASGSPRK